MSNFDKLENFARGLHKLLPNDSNLFASELKKNMRPILESLLSKMELVTREEFDAQAIMLKKTREKLEQLEKKVTELEKARLS